MPGKNGGLFSITSSGVIGASGKPIRVYNMTLLSDTTAGNIVAYNGTSASGNQILNAAGTISKAVFIGQWNAEGYLFPNGLYVSLDAHCVQLNVWAEQQLG